MIDTIVRSPRTSRPIVGVRTWDPFRLPTSNVSAGAVLDVTRTDNGDYRVELPVPGYKPDEIDVTLEESVLTVTGKSERREFTRSFLLPDDIDPDTIEAVVEHGMLSLALHIHPKAQPRKIAVRFGG